MANNIALSNVYNFYQSTYAPKNVSRYDAHKKSELRGVYHSIVKLTKESPLTIADTSEAAQEYAISLKENARILRNTIADLGGLDEGELLTRKMAYSSNEDAIEVKYVGDTLIDSGDAEYEIGITQLAKPQINNGTYLPKNKMGMPAGAYAFDLEINKNSYEFQFNINQGDTNLDLQKRLMRLINNSNLGLTAELKEVDSGIAALSLRSNATGIELGQNILFDIKDAVGNLTPEESIVNYLGLDQISVLPQNAVFSINGEERISTTNHFTLEKTFEVTLKDMPSSPNETVTLGLKPDTESLSENVNRFVAGYNDFIRATSEYLSSQPKSRHLLREMNSITASYNRELQGLGLSLSENGEIKVDESVLRDNIQIQDAREKFSSVRKFTNSVLTKTNSVSLNPMDYVQQRIVAYKNPDATFASPYITSQYSGMMFNSYV